MSCAFETRTDNGVLFIEIDPDAIVIADVFAKTTPTMPLEVMSICQRRLQKYDLDSQ
ncbi:MAG TPA: hypothetical protein PLJ62_08800 [Thermoflexales bacterium]|nr:hypothetical protein [Thermoflexales bacterium]HQW36684.1 hypothetical protein [Thermoflexales bacterium]HRA00284.1 hypothetical protein [Thermoflexales bacterium]